MLTPRQHQILDLIVQLYSNLESPIGSKTLLKESLLDVSPATIRNEMVVLEKNGFLIKAHSSSGRIPSYEGYRYYVNRLIDHDERDLSDRYEADLEAVQELFRNRPDHTFKTAKMVADLMVSLTGFTSLVFGQSMEDHYVANFKLVQLSDYQLMAILMTDQGHVESQIFQFHYGLSAQQVEDLVNLLNDELLGLPLEDAYQRLKLTIPLLIQRQIGRLLDFSALVEKTIQQVKGHQYLIRGKNNLFDFFDSQNTVPEFKEFFNLIEGSKELFDILEARQDGIEVLFGQDFAPESMQNLALITASFTLDAQRMTLCLLGPSTMRFSRIIPMMELIIGKFNE